MIYIKPKYNIKVLFFVCIQFIYLGAGAQGLIPKSSWLKDTVIAGISVQQLRAPREEITDHRWIEILEIQKELDFASKRAKEWLTINFNGTPSFIKILQQLEPAWPVEYYQKEMDAYLAFYKTIPAHLDSVRKAAAEKDRLEESEKERLKWLTKGYCFISKPSVVIREGAFDGGRTIGKLYFGTYVKIEDADTTQDTPDKYEAYVTVPGLPGVEGIIHTSDYVDSLSKLKATDEEMRTFKSRQYAKFEIDPAYAAALKKEQQTESRRGQTASHGTSGSSKQRRYITGPRGGCYYIDSNGNKVYVDHSFCQ